MKLQYDPQESDPMKPHLIKAAEREAKEQLNDYEEVFGFCHMLWGRQKDILLKKYGIDWKTPAEMNPDCLFD